MSTESILQFMQGRRARMDPFDVAYCVSRLADTALEMEYIKKDGTLRKAIGTRNAIIIRRKGAEPNGNGYRGPEWCAYFDLEKQAWRQFSVLRLCSFRELEQ